MAGGSTLRTIGCAGGLVVGKDAFPATARSRSTVPAQKLSISSASASTSSTLASCQSGTRLSLRPAFEVAPSEEEAEAAIAILKQIFIPGIFYNASENGASYLDEEAVGNIPSLSGATSKVFLAAQESDRPTPELHLEKATPFGNLKELQCQGQNILNLFSLLHSNPHLQRIVVSLTCDKAIWKAVMENNAVQELKESLLSGHPTEAGGSQYDFFDGISDIATIIMRWILDNIKTKVMGLIDKIALLVNELFHSVEREKSMNILDDILRSLFMLSLMVSVVVVITRIQRLNSH